MVFRRVVLSKMKDTRAMFYAKGHDQVQAVSEGKEEKDCKTKSLRKEGGWGPEQQRTGEGNKSSKKRRNKKTR